MISLVGYEQAILFIMAVVNSYSFLYFILIIFKLCSITKVIIIFNSQLSILNLNCYHNSQLELIMYFHRSYRPHCGQVHVVIDWAVAGVELCYSGHFLVSKGKVENT